MVVAVRKQQLIPVFSSRSEAPSRCNPAELYHVPGPGQVF